MKTKKKNKIKPTPDEITVGGMIVGSSTATGNEPLPEVRINSFSGDFGRVDINLLRDKVNEIIDFLNK